MPEDNADTDLTFVATRDLVAELARRNESFFCVTAKRKTIDPVEVGGGELHPVDLEVFTSLSDIEDLMAFTSLGVRVAVLQNLSGHGPDSIIDLDDEDED